MRVWDPGSGEPVRSLDLGAPARGALATSPEGDRLAAAGTDRLIRIWDADIDTPRQELAGHLDRSPC